MKMFCNIIYDSKFNIITIFLKILSGSIIENTGLQLTFSLSINFSVGWSNELYLSKVTTSKDCYTFEVLETELELLFFPGKWSEFTLFRSVMNWMSCMKLEIQDHPEENNMTVDVKSMRIQSQGAVFTSKLLYQPLKYLHVRTLQHEQTSECVKKYNNKNKTELPEKLGIFSSLHCC